MTDTPQTLSQRALALRDLQRHDMHPDTLRYLNQGLREARAKFPNNANLIEALRIQAMRVMLTFSTLDIDTRVLSKPKTDAFETMTSIMALLVLTVRLCEEGDPAYSYRGLQSAKPSSDALDQFYKEVVKDANGP